MDTLLITSSDAGNTEDNFKSFIPGFTLAVCL